MESRQHHLDSLLDEADAPDLRAAELLTAAEAAVLLRVARKFIYAHAPRLAVRDARIFDWLEGHFDA